MFLRSLTIRGFKSFADKTTLEFTPGISVIVGPNGSGKSNIADAIAWVLGEQGPRALRGGQMADVIFAGTPGRPALGMAEVGLVIDNTAGVIPVPASEIEISRAIYRSGESEYRLGGRPCRLIDIQELLSDSGVGRTMHTIIGQGHLDDVLVARPEERRSYVEEAAGIAKHRRRRERAARKLAGLEGDLLRLQDLVGELRRQLKPLKQQAELAERHEALTREAGELARKLGAARLRDLLAERDSRRPSWQRAEARQAEARGRLRALDEEIARLDAERLRAEEAAREAERRQEESSRARSELEAGLRGAIGREGRARERLAGATNRSGRLFALEDELARTEAALREVEAALTAREDELEEAEGEFHAGQRDRRAADEERRRSFEQAAARRAEAESLREVMATHRSERDDLTARLGEAETRLAALSNRGEELEAEIERLDGLEGPLGEEEDALHRERSTLAERIGSVEAEEKGLLARQEVVEARKDELAETPGAAFLRRRDHRAMGLLRELVEAPPDLQTALKAALGSFADAVVYAWAEDAVRDAERGGGSGVLLAVAGTTASGPASGPGAPDAARFVPRSGDRRLLEHVKVDPRVHRLVEHLLAEVHVVPNLAEAAARSRVHPGWQFVTPDGTVVGPVFVRTPPGHDVRLEAVRRESASIERDLASVRRTIREGRRRFREMADRSAVIREELARFDALITAAAEEMESVRSEAASLRREHQMLSERAAALDSSVRAAAARLAAVPQSELEPVPLPPPPEPPVHLRVEVQSLRREQGRLAAGVRRTREDIAELAAEDPSVLREELREAEQGRAAAELALHAEEERLGAAVAAYRAAAEQARAKVARHADANRKWREAAAELDRIRAEHEQEDRGRVDLERRIADAERVLGEGHGVDPAEAVASLGEDETVADLGRRSDLVARRIGLLGRVNLLATGELESLQERHDFLVRELDDVKEARRDLERLIEEVDLEMALSFEAAFHDVAREFADLFSQLFPGGEGRLSLTDPGDPLVSGIEVEARPGRKRVKRLSLLSGGERALAALAFLFAIFRARPSPFYLMDEVEAALDDVNLHRFLEIVRGFARDSQILVVTHQKRTMETADVLYGVSMGQGGASAVISQRLAEVEAR